MPEKETEYWSGKQTTYVQIGKEKQMIPSKIIILLVIMLVSFICIRSFIGTPEYIYQSDKMDLINNYIKQIYIEDEGNCFNRTTKISNYLNSINVENEIVTCQINICQNIKPDKVFYSKDYKEIGYFYNEKWVSEKDCLRGHVINSFNLNGVIYYVDSTITPYKYLDRDIHWKCFNY